MRVFGDARSGNCYKVILTCRLLGLTPHWETLDLLAGETRQADFLALNPAGKVPLLQLDDGRVLTESNAIIQYLARDSELLPQDAWQQAQVLQWQFWEQYSHEPYIAVARFIRRYLGLPEERRAEYRALQPSGHQALALMNDHLESRSYFVGERFSLADISLYAYTHVADEGGFSLQDYPHVRSWLKRVAGRPGHVPMAA